MDVYVFVCMLDVYVVSFKNSDQKLFLFEKLFLSHHLNVVLSSGITSYDIRFL